MYKYTLSFKIIKEMLKKDYVDFIVEETYTTVQALAALLEDSVNVMIENRDNYISVIVVLTEIGLKNHMISDYILERFTKLSIVSFEYYKYRNTSEFINSKIFIDESLTKKDFNIYEDDYKYRINMLMGDK